MLGKFVKGMSVKIPAKFQDQNKNAVEMENAIVGIEFFDKSHNEVLHILKDTKMQKVAAGIYAYEFSVPPNANPGNYIIRIRAKQPGNRSDIIEATDFFEVVEELPMTVMASVSGDLNQSEAPTQAQNNQQEDEDLLFEREKSALVDQMRKSKEGKLNNRGNRIYVDDIIVDHLNEPIPGVHVNVFEKASFAPKSPNNTLVASDISGSDGRWKMTLPAGEYVFVYKGMGKRENREFRKIM